MEKVKGSHAPFNLLREMMPLGKNITEGFRRGGSCSITWTWDLRDHWACPSVIRHTIIIEYMTMFATRQLFVGKNSLVVGLWVYSSAQSWVGLLWLEL